MEQWVDGRSNAVNETGLSRTPVVKPPETDIPEALRDSVEADISLIPNRPRRVRRRWWGLLGLAIALLLGLANHSLSSSDPPVDSNSVPFVPAETGLETTLNWRSLGASTDLLLGHFAYREASTASLGSVVPNGSIKLHNTAAQNFLAMAQAAKAKQISLVPVSGFRSIADQTYLFFTLKAKQGLTATERAAVSAPPGYSEHHTGYAVDIADGTRSATDLQITFETTPAFRWLQANAARFGFELSFPKNNSQGVSYEPWHWRFVGDRDSLETFYKAQTTKPARTGLDAARI